MKLTKVGVLAATAVIALSACTTTPGASTAPTGGTAVQPESCKNKKGTTG